MGLPLNGDKSVTADSFLMHCHSVSEGADAAKIHFFLVLNL